MSDYTGFGEIGVSLDGLVATVEMRRPPHNFFDSELIAEIGEAFERRDADPGCRAIVLAAEGRSFCAGADFAKRMDTGTVQEAARSGAGRHLYKEAIRLFRTKKPIVGAIHGPAVGGGLGLALVPDFRVTCSEARFSANFNRLGFHPGFSLTYTLPRLVGQQKANLLFYTGRRVGGDEGPGRRAGAAGRGARRRHGAGDRDRPVGAARGAIDARDGAARLRRRGRTGDRARADRAGLDAQDGRLQGRREGLGRAAAAELRGPLSRSAVVSQFTETPPAARKRSADAP